MNGWSRRIKRKQKSRELWLKEGDRNSKFFHLTTLVRRRRTWITEIKKDNGDCIFNRDEVGSYFINKFNEVYQSSHPQMPTDLDNLIESCISNEDNEITWRKSLSPLKAPGPNGIPDLFCHHYWDIVGKQLLVVVQTSKLFQIRMDALRDVLTIHFATRI